MVEAVVETAADPVEAKGEPTEGKDGADAAEAKIDQKAEEKGKEEKEVDGKAEEGKADAEGKAGAEGKAELKVEEKNVERKVYVPPKGAAATEKESSTRAINPGIQVSESGDLSIGGVRALRLVHEDMLRERYSVSMRPQWSMGMMAFVIVLLSAGGWGTHGCKDWAMWHAKNEYPLLPPRPARRVPCPLSPTCSHSPFARSSTSHNVLSLSPYFSADFIPKRHLILFSVFSLSSPSLH